MSGTGHRGRWLASIRQLPRWEPKNYWQVWLSAAAVGVIWFITWSARGELLVGVVCAGIITLAGGGRRESPAGSAQGRHHCRGVGLKPASAASGQTQARAALVIN